MDKYGDLLAMIGAIMEYGVTIIILPRPFLHSVMEKQRPQVLFRYPRRSIMRATIADGSVDAAVQSAMLGCVATTTPNPLGLMNDLLVQRRLLVSTNSSTHSVAPRRIRT